MSLILKTLIVGGILCTAPAWALTGWMGKVQSELEHLPQETQDADATYLDLKSDLRLGQKSPAIGRLKSQWNFEDTSDVFDADFQTWLKAIQEEKGLQPTGVLDKNTWFALYTQPITWREKELKYALDQWSKLVATQDAHPSDLMVVINLPAMELTVHQRQSPGNYKVIFVSRVVVGKPNARTPMAPFEMTSFKFNPNWTPTPSMLRSHVYKGGEFNPSWLQKKGIVAIGSDGKRVNFEDIDDPRQYRYSQPAGQRNALGQLKFETTSTGNIYLHDTNEPHLYGHNVRAYSSGCIRVEDYIGLASVVANLTDEQVIKKIEVRKTYFEKLPARVPVYFDDSQVRVLGDGSLGFSLNLYGRTPQK